MKTNVLQVIQETEILGKKIAMYGSIKSPLFLAKDVAEWIDYAKNPNGSRQTSKMVNSVDDNEKLIVRLLPPDKKQIREVTVLTEDGLYEVCMQSRKPLAKKMKKEIKKYLKSVRLTGASIVNEQKTVDYYFSSFSDDLKTQIFNEMYNKNQELQQIYDDLINTNLLMDMNTVGKELGMGEYKLFEYLRNKNVLYRNQFGNTVPYQRFCSENKFAVKETPCRDGKFRPVTYVTKLGLAYIRKLLKKENNLTEVF